MSKEEWKGAEIQKNAIQYIHDTFSWLSRFVYNEETVEDIASEGGMLAIPQGEARQFMAGIQDEFVVENPTCLHIHKHSETFDRYERHFQSMYADKEGRSPFITCILQEDEATEELSYTMKWGWTKPFASEVTAAVEQQNPIAIEYGGSY